MNYIVLTFLCSIIFLECQGLLSHIHNEIHGEKVKPVFFDSDLGGRLHSSLKNNDTREHHQFLLLKFVFRNGTAIQVRLQQNRMLLSSGYSEGFQVRHGGQATLKTSPGSGKDHCYYIGSIDGIPSSWAAVSTCDGISGVVFDGRTLHHVAPIASSAKRAGNHRQEFVVLTPHAQVVSESLVARNRSHNDAFCGTTDSPNDELTIPKARTKRSERSSVRIRQSHDANSRSRYVELLLVVDHGVFEKFGKDKEKTFAQCKAIVNIVNALYAPLNIFVGLVGVVIWTEFDEVTLTKDGDESLHAFLHYRKERLVPEMPHDNAQLLTTVEFEGGVVGKALKGPMCTYEYSGGVNMYHSDAVGLVATTVAHEMGHNFGMEHDKEDCDCVEEKCIMSPSSSSTRPTHWSSCSMEYLSLAFERGMDYCLRNLPESLLGPTCGNGFMEAGEQCDCGKKEFCDNPCCDPDTCMLTVNATCAQGACCDLKTCRPVKAATPCRGAEGECDLPEFCTGESEFCPDDIFVQDGTECQQGKAYCYSGGCHTHDDQCRLLWGVTGKSSDDKCYVLNNRGDKHGNCGLLRNNETYLKCPEPDVKCGLLQCRHRNERLEFGMETVSKLAHSFIQESDGETIPCRTALVDMGLYARDPGLTPDGARCDVNKMCVKQRCVAVSSVKTSSCPFDCNGFGICNSKGHCHCNVGYAPPFCDSAGYGGSQDSGPASDPEAGSGFTVFLYVTFLGVIPLAALLACLVYFGRRENPALWFRQKGKPPAVSGIKTKKKNGIQRPGFAFFSLPTKSSQPSPPTLLAPASTQLPHNHVSVEPRRQGPPAENTTTSPSLEPGKFKGFTLVPLASQQPPPDPHPAPTRVAPPPPPPPTELRPPISKPFLETTSADFKGLGVSEPPVLSPSRPAPPAVKRFAPSPPPTSPSATPVVSVALQQPDTPKAQGGGGLAARFKRFAASATGHSTAEVSDSSPGSSFVRGRPERESLRGLDISAPIPQKVTIPPNLKTIDLASGGPSMSGPGDRTSLGSSVGPRSSRSGSSRTDSFSSTASSSSSGRPPSITSSSNSSAQVHRPSQPPPPAPKKEDPTQLSLIPEELPSPDMKPQPPPDDPPSLTSPAGSSDSSVGLLNEIMSVLESRHSTLLPPESTAPPPVSESGARSTPRASPPKATTISVPRRTPPGGQSANQTVKPASDTPSVKLADRGSSCVSSFKAKGPISTPLSQGPHPKPNPPPVSTKPTVAVKPVIQAAAPRPKLGPPLVTASVSKSPKTPSGPHPPPVLKPKPVVAPVVAPGTGGRPTLPSKPLSGKQEAS